MFSYCKPAIAATLITLGFTTLAASPALATGEIGDHVYDMKAHLDKYSSEVQMLVDNVDELVNRYESGGQAAVDTGQLIDWWESVDVHEAVEVNHIPAYADIWQGIYGVKEAIDAGKPVAEVRERQRALAAAWWQGLGVVKMAADYQTADPLARKPGNSTDIINEILQNLDKVAELHGGGSHEEARSLVHSTYGNLFEGVEDALIEQDADLVVDLEKDFNVTLPQALSPDSKPKKVQKIIETMKTKLERADQLLAKAREDKKYIF